MKTIEEITAIIDTLTDEVFGTLYESDEALTAVGLTRDEFDAYCFHEEFPEGDIPEDWSDPDWDE